MNKLAVILPVYKKDNPTFFKDAVESILNQTFSNLVLYVVKDGPISDGLSAVLSAIDDDRLREIGYQNNRGLPSAINYGVKVALKEGFTYIARMDADDISHADRFEKQIAFLEKYQEYNLVGSDVYLINNQTERIGSRELMHDFGFQELTKSCQLAHPSVVFRADFFDKVGLYDESLMKSQDYEFWLRAAQKGVKMGNLNEYLLSFRYEPELIERRKNEQIFNIRIKRKYLKGFSFYRSVLPHVMIMILPEFTLRFLLNQRIKRSKAA